MDFFDCCKLCPIDNFSYLRCAFIKDNNCIYSLRFSSIIKDMQVYSAIMNLDQYFFRGIPFGIDSLDFATKQLVNEIASKKPLYIALINENSNHIAGNIQSCDDLSEFGFDVVKTLNNNGILIDLKNLSERAFMTVINKSKMPCIVTNASLSTMGGYNNLKTYQEKMLVETNGYIIISITKNNRKVEEIAKSIQCFVEKYGSKNLLIGSCGLQYKKFAKKIKILEYYLKILSVDKSQIEDIFYKNANNLINKNFFNFQAENFI